MSANDTSKPAAAPSKPAATRKPRQPKVLETIDAIEVKAVQIGERIAPLIRKAFGLERDTSEATVPVAREILALVRLFDTPKGPQWNRRKLPAMFSLFLDNFYNNAIAIPPAEDLARSAERIASLKHLGALRNRVDGALIGDKGKGLLQTAIVDYCEAKMDPPYTPGESAARRPVDGGAVAYWNYTTLPVRLLKAVQNEYARCELKLPQNLGGSAGGKNPQAQQSGPSALSVSVTLEHVTEHMSKKMGTQGGTTVLVVYEHLLASLVAGYSRIRYLSDQGVKVADADKVAVLLQKMDVAIEATRTEVLATSTSASRAEAGTILGIDVPAKPATPAPQGVRTGAEVK